jgi:predicted GNAT superfamily acetyltransferase
MTAPIEIRDLRELSDLRQVIEIEKRVWGYAGAEEAVPLPILAAGVRRGAIVLGALDGGEMVGATYSFPAVKNGGLTQWSHMLGVVDGRRDRGVGRQLKVRQRERALEMGVDLIEWTFDPLQATNAHLNLVRLGAVVEDYEVNIYGESTSPLWRETESDRFLTQWYIRRPHVERRLARRRPVIRASEMLASVRVLEALPLGDIVAPGDADLERSDGRLRVEIPAEFAPIQRNHPELARAWRERTRAVFTSYLPCGYRIVDFWVDARRGCGTYLLARHDVAARRAAA